MSWERRGVYAEAMRGTRAPSQAACRRDSRGFRVETQPESMAARGSATWAPNKPMKLAGFAGSLSSVVVPAEVLEGAPMYP